MSGLPLCAGMIGLLFVACEPAEARPLHARQSFTAAETTISGNNAQYIIRFDGWVDHAASRIEITAGAKIVETLVPTGDSEPDVLAASAPVLAPGAYELRWHVQSVPDGDFLTASLPSPSRRILPARSRPRRLGRRRGSKARIGRAAYHEAWGISARFLPLAAGAQLVYARDLAALSFIEQSASAKVNLAYCGG